MKIIVSACLAGQDCKYDGSNNRNQNVLKLMEDHDVLMVCPEVMGGLPIPRVPAEIRDGIVVTKDGKNVDSRFRAGAQACLELARKEQPDLIVLQSRSPSCGVKQHYDGSFTGTLTDGPGITAQLLMENGFKVKDIEDLIVSKEKTGCLRPAVAVIGFFVFLFLGALFTSLFRATWIIPIALAAAFGWAIGFSLDYWKIKFRK